MKVHNLTIDSVQRDVTAYPNRNNYVISLENPIYQVEEIRLVSAQIPTNFTPRPNSLILRLSCGSDELTQSVYVGTPKGSSQKGTPHYTGHLLLSGGNMLSFMGTDDPFVHRFHSGPQKIIKDIRIEFLYLDSNGILTPYPFVQGLEHILKFEIKCSTDKLEGLPKVPLVMVTKKEAEIIKSPEKKTLYNQEVYIYIGIIVFFGIMLMLLMKRGSTTTTD